MLTFVAARTRRVKLGTSVMSALFQNPVTLARRFATLDRLSGGGAIAGIGQGDFRDEFEAANIPIKRRGREFEGFVRVTRAVWGPDPVSFTGDFYNIPESRIGPKPVQSGGIPMLLGAFAPASLERRQESPTGSCRLRRGAPRLRSLVRPSITFAIWCEEKAVTPRR
jgi:alkanesulfonate monooxygenase SsuD/methylene tetrahydromethanopterin reductase-like flavin-dependent oxidoreductase (luciferase family)